MVAITPAPLRRACVGPGHISQKKESALNSEIEQHASDLLDDHDTAVDLRDRLQRALADSTNQKLPSFSQLWFIV